jgi:hypothetical protein
MFTGCKVIPLSPDFAFKKSKKTFFRSKPPPKQYLRYAYSVGRENCFGGGFERTYLKTIP